MSHVMLRIMLLRVMLLRVMLLHAISCYVFLPFSGPRCLCDNCLCCWWAYRNLRIHNICCCPISLFLKEDAQPWDISDLRESNVKLTVSESRTSQINFNVFKDWPCDLFSVIAKHRRIGNCFRLTIHGSSPSVVFMGMRGISRFSPWRSPDLQE